MFVQVKTLWLCCFCIVLFSSLTLLPSIATAQTGSGTSADASRYYTTERRQELQLEYPSITQTMLDIEDFISQTITDDWITEPITIPVVFHVLHDDADSRISQEKIEALLTALNHSFNKELKTIDNSGYTFEGFAVLQAVMNIEFCLSSIQYVTSPTAVWQPDDSFKAIAPPVTPLLNLNIWLVEIADFCRGYAQMPGGPATLDGVVINSIYLQEEITNFHKASITHLTANYLGLYPLWGACKCCDDYVEDTPIANAPNPKCYGAGHFSLCSGSPAELTTNYLDANNNECGAIFTHGQVARVKAVLADEGPRGLLQTGGISCVGGNRNLVDDNRKNLTNALTTSIAVFPNPAQQSFTVSSNDPKIQIMEVAVFDHIGRRVFFADQVAQIQLDVDCKQWQNGHYLIRITDTEAQSHFNNIIILQ